ncbi:MAG TPA: FtsQ-type POTRA domain-containing protein [Polyangia bacterium]|nr:FtsQ-type POTRA domain-containing protein [Polyangia bacterium]
MRLFRDGERPTARFDPREDLEPAPRMTMVVPRRGWFRRRRNHRILVARPSLVVLVGDALRAAGRRVAFLGKVLATLAFLAGAAIAGRHLVRHVVASPRFALREIRADATLHVSHEEIVALAGAELGDRLLAIDTDAVAARVATHPWVASVRVRRQLPSALAIDIVERRAVASALLGTLYLVDEAGRPFKRANLDEADGLPVITGIARDQYTVARLATEAAFREALGLLALYRVGDELASARRADAVPVPATRPALSEVHVDPRAGYSLVLYEGGGEILLGRGNWAGKLARLDEILAALGPRGPAALRAVHLDGPTQDRVAVRLAPPPGSG